MRHFVFRWFVTAFAVFVAAPIVGIDYSSIGCLLGAALLLGIINAFIRPILLFLSFPLILVTLGLFILIINALMLKLVSEIVPCFKVHGFWSAIFGAILATHLRTEAGFESRFAESPTRWTRWRPSIAAPMLSASIFIRAVSATSTQRRRANGSRNFRLEFAGWRCWSIQLGRKRRGLASCLLSTHCNCTATSRRSSAKDWLRPEFDLPRLSRLGTPNRSPIFRRFPRILLFWIRRPAVILEEPEKLFRGTGPAVLLRRTPLSGSFSREG